MKRHILFALLCSVLFLSTPAGAGEKVVIPGTGTNMIVLVALAKSFMAAHPDIAIEVPPSSGTSGGYRAAGEGEAILARVSRPATPGKEQEYGLEYLPFGTSTVAFASHPGVKVAKLTSQQTADIFSGKTTNWKDVGGPDLKIRVIRRYEKEQDNKVLKDAYPEWKDLVFTPQSKEGPTVQETIDFIGQYEGAIGYTGTPECLEKGLNIIAVNGIPPTDVQQYPAKMDMALVYKKDRLTGAAKEFVDFIFSPEGADILKKYASSPKPR